MSTCSNTCHTTTVSRCGSGNLIVLVIYILLAIILGSCFMF